MTEDMLFSESHRTNVSGDSDAAISPPGAPVGVLAWQECLWESLVAFEAVQREHHNAFVSGRCDNLMARRAEREKALARVQMQLEAVQTRLLVGEHGDFVQRLQARLAALIDMEAALTEAAQQVRNHMLHELATIRQGSRVLKGYGQHHGASPRPQLVNSQT